MIIFELYKFDIFSITHIEDPLFAVVLLVSLLSLFNMHTKITNCYILCYTLVIVIWSIKIGFFTRFSS